MNVSLFLYAFLATLASAVLGKGGGGAKVGGGSIGGPSRTGSAGARIGSTSSAGGRVGSAGSTGSFGSSSGLNFNGGGGTGGSSLGNIFGWGKGSSGSKYIPEARPGSAGSTGSFSSTAGFNLNNGGGTGGSSFGNIFGWGKGGSSSKYTPEARPGSAGSNGGAHEVGSPSGSGGRPSQSGTGVGNSGPIPQGSQTRYWGNSTSVVLKGSERTSRSSGSAPTDFYRSSNNGANKSQRTRSNPPPYNTNVQEKTKSPPPPGWHPETNSPHIIPNRANTMVRHNNYYNTTSKMPNNQINAQRFHKFNTSSYNYSHVPNINENSNGTFRTFGAPNIHAIVPNPTNIGNHNMATDNDNKISIAKNIFSGVIENVITQVVKNQFKQVKSLFSDNILDSNYTSNEFATVHPMQSDMNDTTVLCNSTSLKLQGNMTLFITLCNSTQLELPFNLTAAEQA